MSLRRLAPPSLSIVVLASAAFAEGGKVPAPRIPSLSPAATVAVAVATPDAAGQKDGRAILQRFIDACGGAAAIKSHGSYVIEGNLSMPAVNITGTWKAWQVEPDRMLIVAEMPGIGKIEQGYDGKVGWSRDPMFGARYITGAELDQLQNQPGDLMGLADLDKSFSSMKLIGRETRNGISADKVELVTRGGTAITAWFDAATGLQTAMSLKISSPVGDMPGDFALSDYKQFGGLKFPTVMRQTAMGMEQIVTVGKVRFDVPASEFPRFSPPADFAVAAPAPAGP